MIHSKQSTGRVLFRFGLICLFILVNCHTALHAATSSLKQIRCHRYEEGGLPVKVRLSLDFTAKPERLTLKKADDPFTGAPAGYLTDFVIMSADKRAAGAIKPVNVRYTNAEGTINLAFADNTIHLAVIKGYELQKSEFKYLDEDNVAYIDLKLSPRMVMPTRSPKVVHDTVFVEKIIHDTVYVEKAGAETIHDTVFVEKIVYVEKGGNVNKLTGINCRHFLHWWNDPHFRIDFKFKKKVEKLAVKESRQKLKDIPPGYAVQYVIYSENRSLPKLFDDVPVSYTGCGGKLILKPSKNKCYLLVKEGYKFKPHVFTTDAGNRVSSLRLSY